MCFVFIKGETAKKTNAIISSARGGTLLIDEAYQLALEDCPRDFGVEAIETVMATIEGDATTSDDRPAYIFAGYPKEMERFLNSNQGLRRRITDTFVFADYSIEDIFNIFVAMAHKQQFTVDVQPSLAHVEMRNCFASELCQMYNAGISREIFVAAKSEVNQRFLQCITQSDARCNQNSLMCITVHDFIAGCRRVQSKLCSRM